MRQPLSFVLGITLGFNLMEETGYLARISFLFDHTMSRSAGQNELTTGASVCWPSPCPGLFLASCASAISKESLLGVLNTLYGTGGSLVSSTFGAKVAGSAAGSA